MLRQIACEEVKEGMFITGFGGSWFDHPFWRGQFLLEKPGDVERVRRANLPYVMIDDALGCGPDNTPQDAFFEASTDQKSASKQSGRTRQKRRLSKHAPPRLDPEHRKAAQLLSQSKETMRTVFQDARLGCAIHSPSINGVVDNIVEAVAVDSQILLTVARLKSKDDYTYLHSVAVCALMVSVGRYLKMEKAQIHDLGMAGLLHDVGKMAIPDAVLNKKGPLSDKEFNIVRNHPERGYELLADSAGICDMAMDVCRHHHERMDGKGYPSGLNANTLSFAARLGAICDIYDALTSNRSYKTAWTPHRALSEMSRWSGHLDREILASLMQAIDMYPTGLLVTLSSGRLAMLMGNDTGRERPFTIAFTDADHNELDELQKVPLGCLQGAETLRRVENSKNCTLGQWEELNTYAKSGEWRSLKVAVA